MRHNLGHSSDELYRPIQTNKTQASFKTKIKLFISTTAFLRVFGDLPIKSIYKIIFVKPTSFGIGW